MADQLPTFEPFMLRCLTYTEALQAMRATGCAIRRDHWCAPIVRLIGDNPFLDDEGEVEASPFKAVGDDAKRRDWEMIPNPAAELPEAA